MGGLGMTEIMVILVIALIVFGPRKLPELGKSLGKAMGQFRRASEDFKRTWEQEVEIEKTRASITESSVSSSSDSYHSSYDSSSYDPYNSDYGYNAPSDAEVSDATTATPVEPATPTAEPATTSAGNRAQPGQWI
ncbi:MAG TPA: twin-arginine translocase TatA/TatE family subunit [Blastocatellia bacterium]|nr:twin-arginine translocase TatA/TatE family subunit [Blastocatellia bacterium]